MPKTNYKYYDVYNSIKNDLIAGKYPVGSMLPIEDELIGIYGASKTTIRHATKLLAEEKYIDIRQGRGTMVLEFRQYKSRHKYSKRDDIKVRYNTGGPGVTTNVGGFIERTAATKELAERMNVAESAELYRIQWLQLVDGRAFGANTHYIRADLVPGLHKLGYRPSEDIYKYFEREYQLVLDHIEDVFDVVRAEQQEAIQLGLHPGDPVLLIKRTGYCEKGVFQYGLSYLRTDIFQMSVTLDSDYFGSEH